jgi:hypothetical protein
MLIRLNMVMRSFKKKGDYPMFYVVDRMGDRRDVVVLIVDILYEERERAEEAVKEILDHLGSYNIKVVDYKLVSYIVPYKEVWRLVAMVAVDPSQ